MLPEPFEYPVIPGEDEVVVQVKVVGLTDDSRGMFVVSSEHNWKLTVVFVIKGIGFTKATIGVRERLIQLLLFVTASA